MSPFDRLGRFVARRAWLVVGAWALVLLAAIPLAPRVPGVLSARRVHPRRPRIGPGEGAPRTGARPPAVGAGHRLQQPHPRGRDARVRRRRGRGRRGHRERPPRRPRGPAPPVAAADLGRPAHRVRHRLPRPAARRLARCPAHPPGTAPRGARADRGAGGRAGVLRRRPERVRGGPPAQRGHLPAARRDRPAVRLRFRGGGRGAIDRRRHGRGGRARGHLPGRVPHADEHLRAQPGDAAGPRTGGRLLAAADEPLPRGAGPPPGRPRPGRRGGPRDGGHRRAVPCSSAA